MLFKGGLFLFFFSLSKGWKLSSYFSPVFPFPLKIKQGLNAVSCIGNSHC